LSHAGDAIGLLVATHRSIAAWWHSVHHSRFYMLRDHAVHYSSVFVYWFPKQFLVRTFSNRWSARANN